MHALPQPTSRRRRWRCRFFVFAALSLVGGCANGDFGEVRPSLVRDDMHDWVGPAAIAGTQTQPSNFELTDDERLLRDLAYPLIQPPYDRQKWYSVLGEYGALGPNRLSPFDRTAYATRLFVVNDRSPTARYAQLIEDIRNDETRLPQFFETAGRVIDMDDKRRRALAFVSDINPAERGNALARIRENAAIISWVHASIGQRATAYRFALERLAIMTPSPQAADIEHRINGLQAENARYRVPPRPPRVAEGSLGHGS